MAEYRILVVDDEEELRRAVVDALDGNPEYHCIEAADGQEALERVRRGDVNLLLTDIAMPRLAGDRLIEEVRRTNPDIPVLVMTGFGTIDSAVDLLRRGAYDYITKPFAIEELLGRVGRALERLTLLEEIQQLREVVDERREATFVGASPAVLALLRQVPSIARSHASVILYGESGTGKEVMARALHAASPRREARFVAVNCGALPDALLENELFGHERGAFTDARERYGGLIREADEGTLFLDEIGEMSPHTQVKLLRFLQDKEYRPLGSTRVQRVDVRIVAATNRDLKRATREGAFREDLYYRLNIIPLTLPPLRDRKEDIPLLVEHFLERIVAESRSPVERFSPLALQKLMGFDWPGNVRELENKVRQVVALAQTNVILPEHVELPEAETMTRADGRLKSFKEAKREVVDGFEIGYVTRALVMAGGNISEAARLSSKHRRAFWEIMKKHGLTGHGSHDAVEEEELAMV